jgi:hypothetical protein
MTLLFVGTVVKVEIFPGRSFRCAGGGMNAETLSAEEEMRRKAIEFKI